MDGREQFTFYRSVYEAIKLITGKGAVAAREQAYDAVCAFAFFGIEPNLDAMDSRAAIAFVSARPNLLASRRKADNGKKGGNAKQTPSKPQASAEQTPSEKEEEKEGEKEKEYECTPPTPSPGEKKAKRFVKPTVDEVRAYCQENGYAIDPQHFVDHYTANGWKVGKTPMQDWKAAVRTWTRNQSGSGKPTQSERPKTFAEMAQEGRRPG